VKISKKRLARRAFDKMFHYELFCPGYKRNKVGALLDKLTPKEREDLKDLTSKDINDLRMFEKKP